MLDLAAAQQDAANAEAREANGEEEIEGERDLDDEVPEAESSESDVSASESDNEVTEDEEGEEGEEEESRADVTFNEDSFIEGSMIEGRVGQMLALEEASMEGSLLEEHDMDDDIPEAGDYEHTDSSLMDSSDEDDGSFVQPGSRRSTMNRRSSGAARSIRSTRSRRSSGMMSARRTSGIQMSYTHTVAPAMALGSLQARGQITSSRLSFDLEGSSSMLEGSSFLRSSPVAARGNVRARLFGARQQR